MLHKPIDWPCGCDSCEGKQFCEYCLNLSGDHREAPWPCPPSLEVARIAAENVTLFGENVDLAAENAELRRQLESARGIAARVFEASDCDCVFTDHPSDICTALSEDEMREAGQETDRAVAEPPILCTPCILLDHSTHRPDLGGICVGCDCENRGC